MKIIFLFNFFVMIFSSSAGVIAYKNLYLDQTIVQGIGHSFEIAKQDALNAIPKDSLLKVDPNNSPALQCIIYKKPGLDEEGNPFCLPDSNGNLYMVTLALVESL